MKKVAFAPCQINGYSIHSVTRNNPNKILALGTKSHLTEDGRNEEITYVLKFSKDPTEASVLSRINFDKIIQPVDYFRYSIYYVFAYHYQACHLSEFLEKNCSIPLKIGLKLMYDCTESIRFLHYNNTTHGNVRLENFLLDISHPSRSLNKENNQNSQKPSSICIKKAILCDLEFAKCVQENEKLLSKSKGDDLFSEDIYSLGIVLSCIWTRTQKTYLSTKKAINPKKIDDLLVSMISQDPGQRPDANNILANLYYFMKDVTQK